ncbi:amidase family protein [Planococcus shixiaomingii]|uniref:amidase family protein n=1 Tax=Planococcus shixiaomingii TaxID=3058393 RepID=UPI0026039606|nr:amidase family protein [Planococcus sp. N022]WKA54566.1 amidase family protein [Planococcus sp. N022]
MDLQTYLTLDATAMAEMVQTKEATPEELLNLSFRRMEEINPELNAFVATRKERALKEAAVKTGGLFAGVPMAVKNISQSLKGEPLSAGSKLLSGPIMQQDSHFTAKLRNSGVSFVGHTNTPEFGLKNITEPELDGPSRNPWNPDFSPGGSSGGSAAAVASGIVPFAGASDGGGSIRIPASFTGLFGLKPTRGKTPVGPGIGRQWQGAAIDFALTRTVRDSCGLLDILQTIQPEAAFQAPLYPGKYTDLQHSESKTKWKIAFSFDSPVGTPISEDAKQAMQKTLRWLESEGHSLEEKTAGIDGVRLMQDYYLMNSGEMALLMRRMAKMAGRQLTPADMEIETWLLSEAGKSVYAADYSDSLASWDAAAAKMAALHNRFDFYMTPATAFTAPRIGELTHSAESKAGLLERFAKSATMADQQEVIYDMFLPSLTYTPYTQLANLTGQPSISVPVHVSESGLPLGVQFMAQKGQDHRLLELAFHIERSSLWIGQKGNPSLGS